MSDLCIFQQYKERDEPVAMWEVLSIATLRLLWVQVMLSLKNNTERENSFSMTSNLFQSEELQFSNIIILPDVLWTY